jgi:DNA-binding FadR family transcriptional regulator
MDEPGPFKPVTSRRTFEEAMDQIVTAIRVGDLKVGEKLPPERDLAGTMRVSRPTLREALKVLTDAGLLRARRGAGGGVFVASDQISAELLSRGAELRVSQVSGVLQARRLLEPRVAQLAAITGAEADFEAMQRTIDLQSSEPGNRDRFVELDQRFHLVMARATRNSTVMELMTSLIKRLEIAYDMIYRKSHEPDKGIALHEETLAAILSRNHDRIAIAMDNHLAFLEDIWELESGRAPLIDPPTALLSGDVLGNSFGRVGVAGDRASAGAELSKRS